MKIYEKLNLEKSSTELLSSDRRMKTFIEKKKDNSEFMTWDSQENKENIKIIQNNLDKLL